MSTLQELIERKEAIDRQIKAAHDATRAEALAKVRDLMAESGLTLADLGAKARAAKTALSQSPKYRDPQTGEGWVGRGKRPQWLRTALASGKTLEQFAAH